MGGQVELPRCSVSPGRAPSISSVVDSALRGGGSVALAGQRLTRDEQLVWRFTERGGPRIVDRPTRRVPPSMLE